MPKEKKTKPLDCADLIKWLNEEYIPWYNQVTGPQTQDEGGSNPNPNPPPPPGTGKGG